MTVKIPGQPQGSTLDAKEWKRAWLRAADDGTPARERLVPEAQCYGTVVWRAASGHQALPLHFYVTEPEHAVEEAYAAARAVVRPRLQEIHGQPANLLPSSLFAAFTAGVATLVAMPYIPYDLCIGVAAIAGAGLAPEIINRRKAAAGTRLTVEQIGGARTASLLTSIGVRAAEDYDLRVMVTDTLRDILWAAPHAGPRATGERIQRIFDSLPPRLTQQDATAWINQHPGARPVDVERSEQHDLIEARIEATTQWLDEESAVRRATNPALPHTTQP